MCVFIYAYICFLFCFVLCVYRSIESWIKNSNFHIAMISNFQHFDVHIFLSVWYSDLFLPLIINSSPFPPSLSRTNWPWVCRRLPRYRSEDLNISGLHFMGYDTFRSLPVGVVSVVPSEWSYPRASEPKPSRPPTCHASLLLPLPISLVIPEYTAFGFLSFLAHT